MNYSIEISDWKLPLFATGFGRYHVLLVCKDDDGDVVSEHIIASCSGKDVLSGKKDARAKAEWLADVFDAEDTAEDFRNMGLL